jgi:hypothetical protein
LVSTAKIVTEEKALSHTNEVQLDDGAFNRFVTLSEKAVRADTVKQDEAFAAAMLGAIQRGKVKVAIGTIVVDRPLMAARIQGYAAVSSCGSPAAMCVESGEAAMNLTRYAKSSGG